MYERSSEPPISPNLFRRRLLRHVAVAIALLLGSVVIGASGFVILENMDWITATLHATTLVSGLGVAEIPETPGAKLFASLFSIYSGFVFVTVSGIIIAPIAHRILHYFHWKDDASEAGE